MIDLENALRTVERAEVDTALRSMIHWKLLHSDEKGGHHLDSMFDPLLRDYAIAISSARKQFASYLHALLS
jgi:hypothetical protein